MPTLCRSTSAPRPSSTRRSQHSRRAVAGAHANLIARPADHRNLPPGELYFGTSRKIETALTAVAGRPLVGPPHRGDRHQRSRTGCDPGEGDRASDRLAGRSVYFASLADIISALAKAEREGQLRERIRFLCRTSLLIVDEIGYLPVIPGGGNLFFQLVNARYERAAMILTSNRGFAEWGEVFGDPVVATALLDRLLHHAVVIQIEGSSYRLRQHADLMPENVRAKAFINSPIPAQPRRRRGRPPKHGASDHAAG